MKKPQQIVPKFVYIKEFKFLQKKLVYKWTQNVELKIQHVKPKKNMETTENPNQFKYLQ